MPGDDHVNLFGYDVLALMASHGYVLLFVIFLIEEAGIPIPIPGDLLLLVAGSMIAQGILGFGPVFLLVGLATLIGTSLLYTLALLGGRPLLRRYGRWLRISEQHLERAEGRLNRRPLIGVAVMRLIPGLRIHSTMITGILAVPRPKATISFLLSGMIWSAAWLGAGIMLGPNVGRAVGTIRSIDGMALPALGAVAVSLGLFWFARKLYRDTLRDRLARRRTRSSRPRLRPATVSAFALAALLVAPVTVGMVDTVGERAELGVGAHLTMTQERPSLTVTR